jgi:hypothetical protein
MNGKRSRLALNSYHKQSIWTFLPIYRHQLHCRTWQDFQTKKFRSTIN